METSFTSWKINRETDSSGERTWSYFFFLSIRSYAFFIEALEFYKKFFYVCLAELGRHKKIFLEKETKEGDSPV